MKRLLKRAVGILLLLVIGLLAPIGYIELACRPEGGGPEYAAILPPDQHRPEGRTLLTYPEWHIVHAYDDYAKVISTGDPHDYKYLPQLVGFGHRFAACPRHPDRMADSRRNLNRLFTQSGSASPQSF